MQPGRPFSLWQSPDRTTIAVGLPGNPVSAFACTQIFIRAWIRGALGLDPRRGRWRLPLIDPVRPNPKRPAFRPAAIAMDQAGRPVTHSSDAPVSPADLDDFGLLQFVDSE